MKRYFSFIFLFSIFFCAGVLFTLLASCKNASDSSSTKTSSSSPSNASQSGGSQQAAPAETAQPVPTTPPAESPKPSANFTATSQEFAKSLRAGWNLGNTFDAANVDKGNAGPRNAGLKTETSWGMPKATLAQIQAVKAAGFSTIRIPISWHNHITDAATYTIDSEWMARVKEVVDWAYDEGLYVIINIHHDNLFNSDVAKNPGFGLSATDSSITEKSKAYIASVWTQVAKTFNNDYDEHLVFEILNEPRERGTAHEWNLQDDSQAKAFNAIITEYEKAAISEIRATGGNNANRFIMVPAYVASPDKLETFTLPADSALNKLVLSFHAYTPYPFCMHDPNNPDIKKFSDKVYGNTIAGNIDNVFNNVAAFCSKNKIGAVCGETSAENKDNLAERVKWAKYFFGKAKKTGCAAIFWDNNVSSVDGSDGRWDGERHGYMNRATATWVFPEIIQAAIKEFK